MHLSSPQLALCLSTLLSRWQGGFSLTSLNLAAYYVTVAFIAFVNTILFAAAVFAKE